MRFRFSFFSLVYLSVTIIIGTVNAEPDFIDSVFFASFQPLYFECLDLVICDGLAELLLDPTVAICPSQKKHTVCHGTLEVFCNITLFSKGVHGIVHDQICALRSEKHVEIRI